MKTHPFQLAIACFVFLAINASATMRYVDLNSTSPAPPYTDWGTAATNIQDAVDAATDGDTVLVTNGVYQTGGRPVNGSALTNRVAVTKPLTLQSVNGPEVTVIQGEPLMSEGGVSTRCVYLTNNATLSGFTLTNGAASDTGDWDLDESGGGVWCEDSSAVVTNCVITGNTAYVNGGGACGGTLVGCTLTGNESLNFGGGACGSALNNCTLDNNHALAGGGADSGTLDTCTVSDNTASWGGGINDCTAAHCALTGNSSNTGGGADASDLNDCTLTGNLASNGGGADGSTLTGCTLSANTAYYGGGADNSALNDCVLSNNTATAGSPAVFVSRRASPQQKAPPSGGGAAWSTLTHCTLAENRADGEGGGSYASTLVQSTLASNLAEHGGGAESCTLSNCILTGNSAVYMGGGVAYCEWLANCTLTKNTAVDGGGAYVSTLNNCALTGNSADYGGGEEYSTLNNCTLTGNSAVYGGGGDNAGALNNCIIYYNNAPDGANYLPDELSRSLNYRYCCTTPLPDNGVGNITNEPALADMEDGNFHLLKNSPCINSGNNAYAPSGPDLDGNPRIAGGTVDIGACEFQSPTSVISYAWLQQYDLSTDGSDDYTDPDGDGMDNWKEWRTGTIPTDPSSVLKMTAVASDVSGITITWQSVSGVTYFLQRSTDLGAQPAFSTIQSDIAGQPDTTSYTDTDATGAGPYFYRVGVEP